MTPSPVRVPRTSKLRSTSSRPIGLRPGAAVLEQVREQPVLGDVGLEAGAVDDEVGRDRDDALLGPDVVDDPVADGAPPCRPCRSSAGTSPRGGPVFICFCQ